MELSSGLIIKMIMFLTLYNYLNGIFNKMWLPVCYLGLFTN